MSSKCHYSVVIVAAAALSGCGGHSAARVAPEDPFATIPIATLPVGSLAGSSALLMAVGAIVAGDSTDPLPAINAQRLALIEVANAAIDTALRRDARAINWMGLAEQRRVARRSPTLGVDPDRLPTVYLVGPRVQRVPDPLWAGMRTLVAMTGARMAIVPAVARITGHPGALTAEFMLVIVDARTGEVLWRGRSVGVPSPTAEAALASAAGAAVGGIR